LAGFAGILSGLIQDAEELLNYAEALVERGEQEGLSLSLETKECYAADARVYQAARTLESIPLEALKEEGLETNFGDGELSTLLSALMPCDWCC
jgi:hypothetical protein